ncbi:MAG: AbrB/MazE/SpoVT family DNA-binding domain-containing protein [Caldilineales bacterium]|nr:AbrB/MazE/SpoVT family DNA-binding domain-containing protein [Caldilineales bacterium]
MTTLIISSKGWIVIPAELRKKYGLHPGERVSLVDYGGVLAIVPCPAEPVRNARGRLKGDRSLVEALMRERAQERARES